MPLFFLLSGFCLALRYGNNKKYKNLCQESCVPSTTVSTWPKKNSINSFNYQEFWHARAIKILPVYYTTFAFAFILMLLGNEPEERQSDDVNMKIWGSFVALYGVQSWILAFGFGPVGPSWTISTLFFFYILFPR